MFRHLGPRSSLRSWGNQHVINGQCSPTESGLIAFNGTFETGQFTIESNGTIELDNASSLTATSADLSGQIMVGSQSRLVVAGTADFAGFMQSLEAYDGGSIDIVATAPAGALDGYLTVLTGGTIEFGQAGGAVAGAVNVDAGVSLALDRAVIGAPVVNDGTLLIATSNGHPTSISGAISGGGSIQIADDGAVSLTGAVAASQTVVLAGTVTELGLGALRSFEAPITGMALGDTIEVDPSVVSARFVRTNGDSGALTLSDAQGTAAATLAVATAAGTAGAGTFLVLPNVTRGSDAALVILASGTLQSGAPPAPATGTTAGAKFTWDALGGDWGTAANWGTSTAAGRLDTVTLSANDSDTRIVSGAGDAATVTVTADYALSGIFAFGMLNVAPPDNAVNYLDIVAGSSVTASAVLAQFGTLDVVGPGAVLNVTGTLTLGTYDPEQYDSSVISGADLVVADGGSVRTESLTSLLQYGHSLDDSITVDATSTVEIGSTGGAAAGALTIDPGHSLGIDFETGELTVHANVDDNGTIWANGSDVVDIAGSLTGNGTIEIGGTETVQGVSGPMIVDSSGTVILRNAVSADQSIVMTGIDNELTLYAPTAATITGFATTDELVVETIVTSATFTQNSADAGMLALSDDGTLVETLNLAGRYAASQFIVTTSPDAGSSAIQFAAACYAEGTEILTAAGPVPIEHLSVGTDIVSASGGTAPVIWLGHRNVRCGLHPRPWDVMPVRVAAHAFGAGLPARDLRLSPDHAIYVGGHLVPVRYLLNGATIVQEHADTVTWWHLELPRHGVVLAEGLPAESYLDTGNRSAFAGNGPVIQAHPDFSRGVWDRQACAGLLMGGPALDAIRTGLLDRAGELGHDLTDDDQLSIEIDGTPVAGSELPPGARLAVLRSRSAAPAWFGSIDHRRLGVAVGSIMLNGMALKLDHPRLAAGWHAPEGDWRWTDGAATLDVTGGHTLPVTRAFTGRYWAAAA